MEEIRPEKLPLVSVFVLESWCIVVFKCIMMWYKKHFDTPIWVYLTVLLVVIALLVVPHLLVCEDILGALLINVGYSVTASLVFAIIVDIGNTIRENKKKRQIVSILTAEWRRTFFVLRTRVQEVAETKYGSDSVKRTFSEWLAIALQREQEDEDEYWGYVYDVVYPISKIKSTSAVLLDRAIMHLDDLEDANGFRSALKSIEAVSSIICRSFDDDECEKLEYRIDKVLIPKFLKLYPEYEELFVQPYDCSDEEE